MASLPITLAQSGAANGQVITWNGTNWVPATPATSVLAVKADLLTFDTAITRLPVGSDGQVLTADATKVAGLTWAAPTDIAAGQYGSSNQVPVFTVDVHGRLTLASNVTISAVAPGGAAGGALQGTYPNPTLAGITSNGVVFGTGNGIIGQSSAFVFDVTTNRLQLDGGAGFNTAPGVSGTVYIGGIVNPNIGLISSVSQANLFLANESGVFAIENTAGAQRVTIDQSGNIATQGILGVYTGPAQKFLADQAGNVTTAGNLSVNGGGLNSYIDGFLGVNGIHNPAFELHVQGSAICIDRFASDALGHGAQLVGRRAYGTQSAPAAALMDGAVGAIFGGYIYDGFVYQEVGEIRMEMDGNGDPGTPTVNPSIPSRMIFRVSPQGSNGGIERMRLDNQGRLMLGTTTANGILTLNGNLAPAVSGLYDIGSSSFMFRDLYLGRNASVGGAITALSLEASDFLNPVIKLTASSSNGAVRNWAITTNKTTNGTFEVQYGASQGAGPSITAVLITNTGAMQANRSLYVNDTAVPEIRIIRNGVNAWGFLDSLDGSGVLSLYDYRKSITRMAVTSTGIGVGPANIAPAFTLDVSDLTASTGQTRLRVRAGSGDGSAAKLFQLTLADGTTEKFSITQDGIVAFGGVNTTGSGSASVGANCPATNPNAPYTWIKITTADGSTAYVPCWK